MRSPWRISRRRAHVLERSVGPVSANAESVPRAVALAKPGDDGEGLSDIRPESRANWRNSGPELIGLYRSAPSIAEAICSIPPSFDGPFTLLDRPSPVRRESGLVRYVLRQDAEVRPVTGPFRSGKVRPMRALRRSVGSTAPGPRGEAPSTFNSRRATRNRTAIPVRERLTCSRGPTVVRPSPEVSPRLPAGCDLLMQDLAVRTEDLRRCHCPPSASRGARSRHMFGSGPVGESQVSLSRSRADAWRFAGRDVLSCSPQRGAVHDLCVLKTRVRPTAPRLSARRGLENPVSVNA